MSKDNEVELLSPIKCPKCGKWWNLAKYNWCPVCGYGSKVNRYKYSENKKTLSLTVESDSHTISAFLVDLTQFINDYGLTSIRESMTLLVEQSVEDVIVVSKTSTNSKPIDCSEETKNE